MWKRNVYVAGALLFSILVIVVGDIGFQIEKQAVKNENASKADQQVSIKMPPKGIHYSNDRKANESGPESLSISTDTTTQELGTNDEIEAEYVALLSSLEADTEQSRSLYLAEENLVKQCMNELGFEYYPNEYIGSDPFAEYTQPVELGDLADAKIRGYGIVESLGLHANSDSEDNVNGHGSVIEVQDSNSIYLSTLSEDRRIAWREALVGKVDPEERPSLSGSIVKVDTPSQHTIMWDTNSCVSAASRAIYGSDIKYRENIVATEALNNEFSAEIKKDSVFLETLSSWKECMASRDLIYEFPGAAAGKLFGLYKQGEISESELKLAEIKISVADAECYTEHQLGSMLASAEQRIGEALAQRHSETIVDLRKSLISAVKTAEQYQ